MDISTLPSKLLEKAVSEFSQLPGIGKRTALRLVLYLLKQSQDNVFSFGNSIIELRNNIQFCKSCHNISDGELCTICASHSRDKSIICIVENITDVLAIEGTNQYRGVYHVLGGIISPMQGIGPSDLKVESLVNKVKNGGISEVIFALSATMEGDTTNYYLFKKLNSYNLNFTTIARGVAFGDELEYTDELTLGRSITNRTAFQYQ